MTKDLQTLVSETRRLASPSPGRAATDKHLDGPQASKKAAIRLPVPRIVEDTKEEPKAAKGDLFTDFSNFGMRVAGLVADESQRRSSTRHCTPFTTETAKEFSYRPRRRRRNRHEPDYPRREDKSTSRSLAIAGASVFALLALAVLNIATPKDVDRSRPVARQSLPSTSSPVEAPPSKHILAGAPRAAGVE